ncbi:MAG: 30S ribosomal protein S20 [Alphaproteobacteria bacterium]|nr:30S ribosomal protein S20 [Alphaproteobacteria bacterium]
MAQHKSAKKRIRRNARRDVINHARLGRIRTFVKAVETAIAGGSKTAAQAALKAAMPEMQRGAGKGVLAKKAVARKISRFVQRIKKLAA